MSVEFEIDHLRYLTDPGHRDQVHAAYRAVLAVGVGAVTVMHEDGDGCCDRESWPVTEARILQAVDLTRVLRVTGPYPKRGEGS